MPVYAYGIKRNPLFWQGNKIGKAYRYGNLVLQSYQWAQGAFTSMSGIRDYMAVAAIPDSNVILVAGGSTTGTDYLSLVERFTDAGVRSTVNALGRAVYQLAGAGNGSKAFFGGGGYSSLSNTSDANMYDSAGVRTSITGLNKSVRGNTATALGNYVVIAGGRINALSGQTSNADAYDQNGTRTRMTDLAASSMTLASAESNGVAFFGFGQNGNTYPTNVSLYNTSLVRIATTNGTTTRASLAATRSGNGVIFAGGLYVSGYIYTHRNTVEHFDTSAVRTQYSNLSAERYRLGGGYINGKSVIFGGSKYNVGAYNTIDIYNDSGVKETSRTLSGTRSMYSGSAVLGGTVYIFGGHNGSVYLSTSETISYK